MADPYIPFGYMPPTLAGPMGPRRMRSPAEMGFTPPTFPTAPNALMPQSEAELADLEQQRQGAINMVTQGAPFALAGPVGRGMAAGGQMAWQAARRSPEAIAGLLAMGGMGGLMNSMEPTPAGAQRAATPSDDVKALQRMLQKEGFYKGKIDGVMGGETQEANAKYEAREARRAGERQQQQQLELQRAQTEAEREKIKLQQEQEKRVREESERAGQLVREGSERLKNMKPSWMEQWGPAIGQYAGLAAGFGERFGIGRFMNRERRELAGRAGGMTREMGQGEVPDRVARVNEFWRQGAPGTPPPFSFQSGRQPFPWAANPAATPAGQLFPPPQGFGNWGPIAITAGKGMAEGGVGGAWYLAASRELHDAENEVNKKDGATPAAVQRLELARERMAQAETMIRFGLGESFGAGLGEMESRLTTNRLSPAVNAAEAERGRLDPLLNPRPAPPEPLGRIPKGQPGAGRFLPRRR